MPVVGAKQVVPVLPLGDTVVHEPGKDYITGLMSCTVVYGFEYAATPSAIPFNPISVSALVRPGVTQTALGPDIPEVIQCSTLQLRRLFELRERALYALQYLDGLPILRRM